MRRIADLGVRYANFHTTALCSPTRSSLLTGRNATSNGMATIAEFSSGFPGISTRIPFENGFISEVLLEHGYNTYCVGKWHLTPGEETGMAASKGRWPLGRGFERFYGFLGGESSSWYPDLVHDNHQVDPPATPEEGYHISKDLSDKAIEFIRDAKVVEPDKPFFLYLSLDAAHAPHHVFKEWADKYKGRFDQGYEAIRAEILARQKELGLLPDDTELSPINPHGEPAATGPDGQPWPLLDTVRPWDSLSDDEKRLFARMAEVFAGYVSYTDDQLGRVIDFLEESGQLDNTIIVVISDNGASGEGGPNGTFNEWRFFNGVPTPTELTLEHIDELGSPKSYNHYNTGWAWAFDTPFPYWKRWAGYEGGIADMCLVSWPAKIARQRRSRASSTCTPSTSSRRSTSCSASPRRRPSRATSRARSRARASRPRSPTRQRPAKTHAVLRDARAAVDLPRRLAGLHPAPAAQRLGEVRPGRVGALRPGASTGPSRRTCAEQEPERLERMKALWFELAEQYNGLPLDDRTALEQILRRAARAGRPRRDRYVYYPDCAVVPEQSGVSISGRSYTIAAGVKLDSDGRRGRPLRPRRRRRRAQPVREGRAAALHVQLGGHAPADGRRPTGTSTPGSHVLTAEFAAAGPQRGPDDARRQGHAHALRRRRGGRQRRDRHPTGALLRGRRRASASDATTPQPVTPDYTAPFRFTGGTIDKVVVDVSGERYVDHEAEVRGWFLLD